VVRDRGRLTVRASGFDGAFHIASEIATDPRSRPFRGEAAVAPAAGDLATAP